MLIKRNLLLFFRDRANVLFSLMAVFIIIGLYILFMGNAMEDALNSALGYESDKAGLIMSGLTMSGIIATTSVTSCLGALGVSVMDKQRAAKDFLTSPMKRGRITMGYILGSAGVSVIMTFCAMVLCIGYIVASGGTIPGFTDILLLILTTVLSVLCGNSIIFFITLFIGTQNAFGAASSIIGTFIGFILGVYFPIGQLPSAIQWVIRCFPMGHAASMFKLILSDKDLASLFASAPPGMLGEFRLFFGVAFNYGSYESSFWFSAAVLAVSTVVFYLLSILKMRGTKMK